MRGPENHHSSPPKIMWVPGMLPTIAGPAPWPTSDAVGARQTEQGDGGTLVLAVGRAHREPAFERQRGRRPGQQPGGGVPFHLAPRAQQADRAAPPRRTIEAGDVDECRPPVA